MVISILNYPEFFFSFSCLNQCKIAYSWLTDHFIISCLSWKGYWILAVEYSVPFWFIFHSRGLTFTYRYLQPCLKQ
jgi:hypothetical protein